MAASQMRNKMSNSRQITVPIMQTFSSVHLLNQFYKYKEDTFTIKMYNTSRKKEEKKKTNCKPFTKIKFDYTIITD